VADTLAILGVESPHGGQVMFTRLVLGCCFTGYALQIYFDF
jgi:hypothetical protein